MAATTCERCLQGSHVRCRGCACTICTQPAAKPRGATRRRTPAKPRARPAPARSGPPRKRGPAPMTDAEEAEIRTMVLQLVERIAANR